MRRYTLLVLLAMLLHFIPIASIQVDTQRRIGVWLATDQIVIADADGLSFYTPELVFVSRVEIISDLLYGAGIV